MRSQTNNDGMSLDETLQTINHDLRDLRQKPELRELRDQIGDSIEINCLATKLYRAAHKLPFIVAESDEDDRCFMNEMYTALALVFEAGRRSQAQANGSANGGAK